MGDGVKLRLPIKVVPIDRFAPVPARWQRILPWALAALGLGTAIGMWAMWQTAPVVPNVQARFSYTLPEGVEFSRVGRQNLALSPDGTMVAFIANDQIYIRRLGELDAQPLRGSNLDPLDLVFSPDSQSVAFSAAENPGGSAERSRRRSGGRQQGVTTASQAVHEAE